MSTTLRLYPQSSRIARTLPHVLLAAGVLILVARAHGQFNLAKPETPLLAAAASGDTPAVKQLLKAGANPNEGRLLGLPPVMFPLMMQNRDMVRAFLNAKADLRVRDKSGATTLMWALYDGNPDPETIQKILAGGVDPNTRDEKGDTALIWAMRRGNATAIRLLETIGGSRDSQIREATQKSLALLQSSSPQFIRVSGCVSCHHQVLPAMAMAIARDHGIAFNQREAANDVEATMAMWKNMRQYMSREAHRIPNPPIVVSYSLVGLAAQKYPPDETTRAMVEFVAGYQETDGSWRSDIRRPPIEASDITATAISLRALQLYGGGGERVTRAAAWLAREEPSSNEERVMQFLGLYWSQASRALLEQRADKLLAAQLPGGGWSQCDTPEADAYATGQSLFALFSAGILKPADAPYRKGIDYLLRTQLSDGSWLVTSRSHPVQPYKESGFPHGKDQWISAAATSWAAMALGLAAE